MNLFKDLRIVYYFIKRYFRVWTYFKVNFVLELIQVVIDLATMAIIASAAGKYISYMLKAYGGDYFAFIVLGLVCNQLLSVALTAPRSAIEDAFWGRRIEILFSSPVNPTFLVTAFSIGPIVRESVKTLIYLLTAILLGLSTKPLNILSTVVFFTGFLACMGIGLISASTLYLLEAKGGSDPVNWIASIVARLLSGLYYPLNILPEWCRWLSLIVPHTYVFDAERRILLGSVSGESSLPIHSVFVALGFSPVLADLVLLAIYAGVVLPLSYYLIRKGFEKALRDGRLSWWS
ncbi:MAG: hypothetical protein DRN04_02640 [Thermoprotei archaeon]|nr:MAG: hypothetical protein DRN04_02640 [Thermoprotei archaeon]